MNNTNLWYGYKYYRGRLSPSERRAYDAICVGLQNCEASFTIQPMLPKACTKVFNAVLLDCPACFHVNGFSIETSILESRMRPTYIMPKIQYQMQCHQIDPAIQSLLSSIKCADYWTTLKKLHAYIIEHLIYQETGPASHSMIGPLLSSSGVCEGVAKLTKYVCDRIGLQSAVLAGTAIDSVSHQQDNHAWNAIQVDGDWYCFDFTFDMTLNADNPCKSLDRYDYFALSTEEMAIDHQSEEMIFPPCAQRKDYFTLTRSIVGCTSDLRNLIKYRVSPTSHDLAFKVNPAWISFLPEAELNKAFSPSALLTTGAMGYSFSYNQKQRVCYVHFN